MFEVVQYADLVGKTFAYGGRGPGQFDCYGLLAEMQRRVGRPVPDYISPTNQEEIASLLACEVSRWKRCECIPGVGVAFRIGRYVSHVGFMLTPGTFIHAWKPVGVCVERLDDWERRVAGFYTYAP